MGEAKRRKAIDPSYGKPKRGLVVSCPIEITTVGGILVKDTNLDQQELRASLLYWDRLAWPSNNAVFIEPSPDATFLIDAGVLSRPHFALNGVVDGEAIARVQEIALEQLNSTDPGAWALAQGENMVLDRHAKLAKDEGVAVELLASIPVPDRDVPLNEILEFRHKRYDEMRALREEIDNLAKAINDSSDPQAELEQRIREIDKKCAAAIHVGSEWRFPVRLSNLKATFDIKPFAALRDGIIAFGAAHALGASTAAAAAAVGAHAVSSLAIKGDVGWVGLKDRNNPYRYVSQFHKELF